MNLPLKSEIIDGVLTIKVGADVLAFATENHPSLLDEEAEPLYHVSDEAEWMRSVHMALSEEDAGGGNMIMDMLDSAILHAVEQGYEGIDEDIRRT